MSSAACCMSNRYFRASSCIEKRSRRLDPLQEVGVLDRGGHHQIDRPAEQRLERLQQAEVAVRELAGKRGPEVDEEIEVAVGRIKPLAGRRSKHLQPADAEALAKLEELLLVTGDDRLHGSPQGHDRAGPPEIVPSGRDPKDACAIY